jgi:alkanesulfonate monooxygenase SsuD/methylene tetrahydromethanopterin reductase-like flavin-dependent oxidoreductase (luciferase family)
MLPLQPAAPEQLRPFARIVDETAARRLYLGQSFGIESHLALAHLAGSGLRVPVGTAVSLMPLRHPAEAAMQARTVAALTGHPFVAGLGVSEPGLVAGIRGEAYASPRTAAADYLRVMRGLLDGGPVRVDSDYTPARMRLPPMEHPPVELALGVLRPRMAETAGQVADVAITWLAPPAYLRDVVAPALRRGAEAAGRPVPRLVAVVHAAVDRPGRDPLALLRSAAGAHLRRPHYAAMLREAGIDASEDDPDRTAAAVLGAGGLAWGDPAGLVDGLRAYAAAGVDEVALNVLGVIQAEGLDAGFADLRAILAAAEDAGLSVGEAPAG